MDVCETCSERIVEVLNPEMCPICGEEWLCVIDGTRHDYQNHDKQLARFVMSERKTGMCDVIIDGLCPRMGTWTFGWAAWPDIRHYACDKCRMKVLSVYSDPIRFDMPKPVFEKIEQKEYVK